MRRKDSRFCPIRSSAGSPPRFAADPRTGPCERRPATARPRSLWPSPSSSRPRAARAAFTPAHSALSGRPIHVLTFNDYLARRDAAWMGPAYRLLGLSVGAVQESLDKPAKRAAYASDITYATAKEAGFDYLRDRLAFEPDEIVHRPFAAALIDEADSILVDEARIPLVISGTAAAPGADVGRLADLVRSLGRG